jgi:NADH dehydrogenase
VNVVTGAFSYTGRAIAEALLARGEPVRTLSRRDAPGDPLRTRIEVAPLRFDGTGLADVRALYNTYWIRFERGGSTFDGAVANTIALFESARRAGVERIVHVSVANADRADDLPYFRGKRRLETWLARSGIAHAIVRPTLVFGPEDILVNNVAWLVRHSPLFIVPGAGDYRVQPVSVADTARIAVEARDGETVDAAGPDTFAFGDLVARVRDAVGARCRIVHGPRTLGLAVVAGVGRALRDVVVTREELVGLERSLLTSAHPPLGRERFGDWLAASAARLGRRYVSELARNFRGEE